MPLARERTPKDPAPGFIFEIEKVTDRNRRMPPDLYVVIAENSAQAPQFLQSLGKAHSEHLAAGAEGVAIVQGGPYLDAEGAIGGGLLIFKSDSEAKVRQFMEQDPYFLAGAVESLTIYPWRCLRGHPLGHEDMTLASRPQ